MKNKSLLNKIEDLKPRIPKQIHVERNLLPRLKLMGYILSGLAVCSLTFAILAPKEPSITQEEFSSRDAAGMSLNTDEDFLELNPTEVLNFYMVSFLFASVGAACFLITWKKRKLLFREVSPQEKQASESEFSK
jgi:hypothetical protein